MMLRGPVVTIARDPFARTETVRTVAYGNWDCPECGATRNPAPGDCARRVRTLYHYSTETDAGRLSIDDRRAFCSVGCMCTYHGAV